MTDYHVAHSPLTNTVYAGRVNADGTAWVAKSDVTTEACAAVAQLAEGQGEDRVLTVRTADGSGWDIKVTAVPPTPSESTCP